METKIEVDSLEYRNRILAELTSHIGKANAISMPALYRTVFERPWSDRINDTRRIRKLVEILRAEGKPIGSVTSAPGGYYLPVVGSEMAEYLRRNKFRALRILARNAKMMKTTLPNYLGQLKLESEGGDDKAT